MSKGIDVKKCYHLPWKESDNPNGWIEPTTHCNITCPGCYRGIDKPEHKGKHLELSEMKNQIDLLITKRNIHTLSIAGGEPLMYPQLDEVIQYASEKGLRTMLYTNGYLLNTERLQWLQDAGLTQVVIHVDRFQKRPDITDRSSHIDLRNHYIELFRNFREIRLGFIQPVSLECDVEVKQVMKFLKKNFEVVNLMVFTLYRNICNTPGSKPELNTDITVEKLVDTINRFDTFKPASCLVSEQDKNETTWLFGQRFGINNKIFGHSSASFYKLAHTRYRKNKGKHLFISRANSVKSHKLLRFIPWFSIFKTLVKSIPHRAKTKGTIFFQTILILRGPVNQGGEWDLCDGCPDRIIYKGKLVPSCILENLKDDSLTAYTSIHEESGK